jgi:hypothetical protein
MFNFGEFLSFSNFVWRAFIKKSSLYEVKQMSFWSEISQKNKYTGSVFK